MYDNTMSFMDIVDYDTNGNTVVVEENSYEVPEEDHFDDNDDDMSWLTGMDEEGGDDAPVEEERDLVSIGGNLDILDDAFEFTIGEEKFTKTDLIAKVQASSEAVKKSQELDGYFQNFKQIDDQMNHQFIASATENDIKLTNVKNKLRDPNITDSDRGRLYGELTKLEGNKKVLDDRVQGFFAAKEMREQQAELVKLTQVNNVMSEKYGNQWVDTMAPAITNYINESGIASPEMRKAISPAMLEVLLKAMKFDKLDKGGTAKVKAAAAKKPTAARSTTSRSQGNQNKMSKSEMEYRRALKTGDQATLFKYIKD